MSKQKQKQPQGIELDPDWRARLERMATAAGTTPAVYLRRLLERAWIAMPSAMRSGSVAGEETKR